jgi:DNA-binding winged helix-turn-helix (wHTH) protein
MTVREFETFYALAQRADSVVPRAEIYRLVWCGHMAHRDRSVDVFVRKVRRKLEAASPGWVYIHTHFGIGYRFRPSARARARSRQRPARSRISFSRLRSFTLARRIAVPITGATSLENPAGSPRLRRIILVASSPASAQV